MDQRHELISLGQQSEEVSRLWLAFEVLLLGV